MWESLPRKVEGHSAAITVLRTSIFCNTKPEFQKVPPALPAASNGIKWKYL